MLNRPTVKLYLKNVYCVFVFLRRRCFSGGGSGPVGHLAPGAVVEESGVKRDTV